MSTHEASTSNPFDVLNMVDFDELLGDKGINTKQVNMVDISTPNVDVESLRAKGKQTGSKYRKKQKGH
ncbi:hypothetical protein Tco_1253269 [Tanacetum coccineum]